MGEQAAELRCGQCGYPHGGDTRTMGLCPRCLLARVLDVRRNVQAQIDRFRTPWPDMPSPEALEAALPQLQVGEPMGWGGMGLVYRARQKNLDREVALKILPADAQDDPAAAARFLSEARILASLNHPNIVMALEAGQVGNWLYLVMELVDGPNLREILHRQGRIEPRQALGITMQVCEALSYAHARQVIHRDVKPENILLDPAGVAADRGEGGGLASAGRARLADFGLAKLRSGSPRDMTITAPDQYVGTADYVAPECRRGARTADASADLYALGVVIYEMLTGRLPVGHFAPPSRIAPVNKRVDAIVLRCLAAEAAERYASAEALRRDLSRALTDRAGIRRVAVACLLAVGVVAAVVFAVVRRDPPSGGNGPAAPVVSRAASSPAVPGATPGSQPSVFVLMPGDAVRVKWGNQWFDGTVVRREGRRVLVHYEGWSDTLDEWVDSDRLQW